MMITQGVRLTPGTTTSCQGCQSSHGGSPEVTDSGCDSGFARKTLLCSPTLQTVLVLVQSFISGTGKIVI